MMELILIMATVFSTFHPVDIVLPAQEALEESVYLHWQEVAETEAIAYRQNWKKDRWADYMPSVGLAYTPSGAPRPGVSFSLGTLIASRKKKREAVRMETQIRERFRLQAEQEVRALRARLDEVAKMENARVLDSDLLELERMIFAIVQDEFDRAQEEPKKYLAAKRKWLTVQAEYHARGLELERAKRDLLVSAYWEG